MKIEDAAEKYRRSLGDTKAVLEASQKWIQAMKKVK